MKIKAQPLPHSWLVCEWPSHVVPNNQASATFLVRQHRKELIACGALARIGRNLIVYGEGYGLFLSRKTGLVENASDPFVPLVPLGESTVPLVPLIPLTPATVTVPPSAFIAARINTNGLALRSATRTATLTAVSADSTDPGGWCSEGPRMTNFLFWRTGSSSYRKFSGCCDNRIE